MRGSVILSLIFLIIMASECASGKVKVLCLHGYLSNGYFLQMKLRRLIDLSSSFAEFVFIDAPNKFGLSSKPVSASGITKCRWWNSVEDSNSDGITYEGLENSVNAIIKTEREQGPFDIIIGHSQGACLAIALGALQEYPEYIMSVNKMLIGEDERNDSQGYDEESDSQTGLPKTDLVISMSGFPPRDGTLSKLFREISSDPRKSLRMRSLHIMSMEDEVVPIEASISVSQIFMTPKLKFRNGTHSPPEDDECAIFMASAIQDSWDKKFKINKLILED